MTYQIWAFTQAGVKTAYLENAFSIQRKEKINQTPTLSFSLPVTDLKSIYLTSAYEIKIYNSIKKRWEGLYTLDCTEKWSSSASVIEANYSGVISQLVKEDNITYDTTVTPKTPTQIITAILAMQARTPAIAVGTIQPTTAFAFSVENAGMLESIFKCVEYLGGYIEVDSNRALNWYNDPSGSPVREIRYQKNMAGISQKSDFTQIINRLYAYGAENPDVSRLLNLTDAGELHEYVEDSTLQTVYGISRKRRTDGRITHPSTLLRWANKILAQYKDPIYYYDVDVVNLAEHADFDFDFEELTIGQMIRVVNSDLNNLSVNVSVVGVDTNLSEPEKIKIELSTNTPDISDSFETVKSQQNLSQNVAVQLGAGQVTIQGIVTIEGWKSAGTTTINGGMITANTITTTQLNFTPVTGGTIIASINASTEGTPPGTLKIAANHISISGDCTFSAGYDPSTKIKSYYQTTAPTVGIFAGDLWIDTTVGHNNIVYRYNGATWDTALDKVSTGNAAADINANTTTISGGKITTNTIDCDALKTSTINAKTITLGTTGGDAIIKSGNYVADTSGWQIKADGSAEFQNVKVRGKIYTGTLEVGNILTCNGTIQSTTFTAGSAGWQIKGDGTAELNSVTVRGTIYATSGEFTGTLKTTDIGSGSTMTVNGTVQSAGYSAVPTYAGWQIKGNGDAAFNNLVLRGNLNSVNWSTTLGSQFDMTGGTFKLGGSTDPKLSWNGTTLEITGTLKTTDIKSGSVLTINGTVQSNTYSGVPTYAGWQLLANGNAEFNNIKLRGNLDSINWSTTLGTRFDMDLGKFYMGGSSDPALSWNGTTLEIIGTLKTTNIKSGSVLTINGTVQSSTYSGVPTYAGWQLLANGNAEFNNIKLRGNLDSINWATDAGMRIDVDLGKIWCGGSSAPKLYWNGTTLSIEGAIKATSGEFTGTLKTTNIEAGSTLTIHGTISVTDGVMQSGNYATLPATPAGWKIFADGSAEFNSVTIRGTIYATSGEFSGTLKTATLASANTISVDGNIETTGFTTSYGWRLWGNGNASFHDLSVGGDIGCITISSTGTVTGNSVKSDTSIGLTANVIGGNRTIYTDDGTRLLWKDASGGIHILT